MRRGLLVTALVTAAVVFTFILYSGMRGRTPTHAFPPAPSPAGAEAARVSTASVALPTFNFEEASYTPAPFAMDRVGPGYPYRRADRSLLDGRRVRTDDRTFTTVVLENEYLKVTVLPDLGGRLFEAVFKPTGERVFYRAERLTPYELWDCGKEWMFATGGLRFEFPTWGHDPNTEERWEPELHTWPNGTASVSLSRTDVRTGLTARVHLSLDAGRSWIRIDAELANPHDYPQDGAFWVITGLMGTRGIEFIMPTEFAIEHGGEHTDRWPVSHGVDWAYFRNWSYQRSFFALDWSSDFSGLYDHVNEYGVVRCADPTDTPGLKLWGEPRSMERYYVSLYGGLTQTMEEKVKLAPGEVRRWQEIWYPVAHTGGLTAAGREVAVSLHTDGDKLVIGVLPTCVYAGASVRVLRGETVLLEKRVGLDPAKALVETVELTGDADTITVHVTDTDGRTLLEETLSTAEIRPVFKGK